MSDVTLKEHFDDKIADLKTQNSVEHAEVVAQLKSMERRLGKVVTWPALATAILVGAAIYGALQA